MQAMFISSIAFNQDISNWAVHNVKYMSFMFYEASAFNQTLGWCLELYQGTYAFLETPCQTTSCGVKRVPGGCAPTPVPTVTPALGSDAAPKTQFTSFGALLGAVLLML